MCSLYILSFCVILPHTHSIIDQLQPPFIQLLSQLLLVTVLDPSHLFLKLLHVTENI